MGIKKANDRVFEEIDERFKEIRENKMALHYGNPLYERTKEQAVFDKKHKEKSAEKLKLFFEKEEIKQNKLIEKRIKEEISAETEGLKREILQSQSHINQISSLKTSL